MPVYIRDRKFHNFVCELIFAPIIFAILLFYSGMHH